jgi:alkanesulfonate monooxygenase SsuD/methylene tetrahydromethanopterin reductase-like flavin-dependent oxidoreductase (luciferase family)
MTYRADAFDSLVRQWRWAEEVGYEAIYVGDHLWSRVVDGSLVQPRYDTWVMLAALAMSTTRVTIGPYVTSMPYRHPAVVAKQAVTLDHLSGGRLQLGLGSGGNPADLAAAGLDHDPPARRAARFAEYVEVIRGLLEQTTFEFSGDHYRIGMAVRHPAPVQQPRPRLTIAAHTPQTLGVAARHADTWSSYGVLMSATRAGTEMSSAEALQLTRDRIARLEESAFAAGRDPAAIRRSFLVGFTPDMPWASEDAFRDLIDRYSEIGIDEFVLPDPLPAAASPDLLVRLSQDVMPDLRRHRPG